jgi:hypothetical protein
MTITEKEHPLEEVIMRNDGQKSARSEDDSRIQRDSDGRGSKETSNGVLDTPPPEDEFDDENPELFATEINPDVKKKTKVFYSDKSESSVESMMADTPSNYNILNGRFDDNKGVKSLAYGSLLDKYQTKSHRDKSVLKRPNLDIISENEAPYKAPPKLNTIKHIKTTMNERNFIDSVLGSDKTSYMGDAMAGSLHGGLGGDSDRGPASDNDPITKKYDDRRHSKSNMRRDMPSNSLEENKIQRRLKLNQFMISNNGSDDNAGLNSYMENRSHANYQSDKNDPVMTKEIKSSLPPIRYPKQKIKSITKKNLIIKEDKNQSMTSVKDLESAYI